MIAWLAWGLILLRAADRFDPLHSIHGLSFNSDSAIPVLMANEDRAVAWFGLYYYGADRWGGWAFFLANAVHRVTGLHWSPHMLAVLQVAWVFLGAWIAAGMVPRDRAAVVLCYLVALCLHQDSRFLLFNLSQVYAWILVPLLLAWWALRAFLDASPGFSLYRLFLLFAAVLLSLCSSISSLPYLLVIGAVESLRAAVLHPGARPLAVRLCAAGGAFGAAMGVEALVKASYHGYVADRFARHAHWQCHLDLPYLADNLAHYASHLARLAWFPLYVFPVLVFAAWFIRGVIRGDRAGMDRAFFSEPLAVMALGCTGMAAANLALVAVADHVRLSAYDTRFLTLMNLLAPFSGLLTAYLLLDRGSRWLQHPAAKPAMAVAGFAAVFLAFPPLGAAGPGQARQKTADDLARKAPGAVLLGDYWETYAFAALQETNAMLPLPFDGQELRMPWIVDNLRTSEYVAVEYLKSRLWNSEVPPEEFIQYGCTLRIVRSRWHVQDGRAYAVYRNASK
jgi:hypothetical protein